MKKNTYTSNEHLLSSNNYSRKVISHLLFTISLVFITICGLAQTVAFTLPTVVASYSAQTYTAGTVVRASSSGTNMYLYVTTGTGATTSAPTGQISNVLSSSGNGNLYVYIGTCTSAGAPSTFIPPTGVSSLGVELWGGGGPGGANTTTASTAGGGGGAGSYVSNTALAVTPLTSYNISVGTGGVCASTGNGTFGSPGGSTTFSTLMTASGGTPGSQGNGGNANGVAGVLGGVYGLTVTAGTSTYTAPAASFAAATAGSGAAGVVKTTSNIPVYVGFTSQGSGYTQSSFAVTFSGIVAPGTSPTTAVASVNPNINNAGSGGTTSINLGTGATAGVGSTGTGGTGAAAFNGSTKVATANSVGGVGSVPGGGGSGAGTTSASTSQKGGTGGAGQIKITMTINQPPTLIAAITNVVTGNIVITFTDNTAWRNGSGATNSNITSVKYGSTTLVAGTDYTLAAGTLTLIPTGTNVLSVPGSQTVTVSSTGYLDATVTQIIVAGSASKLQVLMPGETAAPGTTTGKTGTPSTLLTAAPLTVTVNSVDAYWNLVSSIHTIGITSSTDGSASLPANAALVAGTQTYSVTFNTVGSQTVTATDITTGLTANTSTVTTVNQGSTATVTYNGNGNTGGSAPTDGTAYATGTSYTVLGAGTLTKTVSSVSFNFTGWNTAADGSGTAYVVGATPIISANVTLYAQWAASVYTTANNGDWNTPSTWTLNEVPKAGSPVTINHAVTVNGAQAGVISGAVTISTGKSITFGASGTLSAASLSIGSSSTLSMASGGTLTLAGALTNSGGTFTAGTGTVAFTASNTLPAEAFNNLTISGSGNITTIPSSTSITVGGALTTASSGKLSFAASTSALTTPSVTNGGTIDMTSGGTLFITGNTFTSAGIFIGGTGTLSLSGSAITLPTLTTYGNITITAGLTTWTAAATISLSGNLSVTGGILQTDNTVSGSTINVGGSLNISGTGIFQKNGTSFTGTINLLGTGTTSGTPKNITIGGGTCDFSKTAFNLSGFYQVSTGVTLTGTVARTFTISATGSLVIPSSVTVDFALFSVLVTSGGTLNLQSGGTLKTSSLVALPIPVSSSNIIYNGTVNYSAGAQTVTAATYNNLILTTGTNTAGGAITVNGDFTNSGTFAPSTFTVTFGGTVAQNITGATTFYGLTISNTTQPVSIALSSAVTVSNLLTINSGAALQLNSALTLSNGSSGSSIAGTLQLNSGGSIVTNAPIYSGNSSTVLYNTAKTTALEWNGTGSTIGAGVPANVTIGAAVTLAGARQIPGVLTLNSGNLTTTTSNSLTINNVANSAIANGSATSYINGPVTWNQSSSSTGIYTLPVGNSSKYLPLTFVAGSNTGSPSITVTSFNASPVTNGQDASTLYSISNTEYWSVVTTAGFDASSFSIARSNALASPNIFNAIARSTSNVAGSYSSIGGTEGTNAVNTSASGLSGAATIYLTFGQTQYTITYNNNVANFPNASGTIAAVNAGYNNDIVLSSGAGFSSTTNTFGDWNTNAAGTGTTYAASGSYTVTASATLYAHWLSSSVLRVNYNGNGNTGGTTPSDLTNYAAGNSITTKTNSGSLVKSGYTFSGWNTNISGTGTTYAAGATNAFNIAVTTTLYAKWTIASFRVTYDLNPGTTGAVTGTVPTTVNQNYNTSYTTASGSGLSKTGYSFAGWNTVADGSGTSYSASSSQAIGAANITLYAQWAIATYISNASGDWTTPATWIQGSVPQSGYPVIINNAVTVTTNLTGSTFGDVSIASSGSLTFGSSGQLSAGAMTIGSGTSLVMTSGGTLNIGGDFTNNSGTFTQGTGTVNLNGSGIQSIASSSTFNKLTISNASATIGSGVTVTTSGLLTIAANFIQPVNSTINANGGVTVGANASLTISPSSPSSPSTGIASNKNAVFNNNGAVILTASSGANNSLVINGWYQNVATTAISIGANNVIVVNNNGVYNHNVSNASTAGTVPSATWAANSYLYITGTTAKAQAVGAPNTSAGFGNVVVNCPVQTSGGSNLNANVQGDLIVAATGLSGGSGNIRIFSNPSAGNTVPYTIGGNLQIGGSYAPLGITASTVAGALFNVGNNGTSGQSTTTYNVEVKGNVILASYDATHYASMASTTTATLLVDGNWIQDANASSAASTLNVTFQGSSAQTISGPLKISGATAINNTHGVSLLSSSSLSVTSLTLTSGTLTVGANNSLSIGGNAPTVGSGNIDASAANVTVTFTNNPAVVLPSGLFSSGNIANLAVSPNSIAGGVTLGQNIAVSGSLSVTTGTLDCGVNLLTLKSTSITNTAIVGTVGTNGTITGTATVERYIPAGYRAYRDIAPEVYNAGSMFKNWQENGAFTSGTGIFISGHNGLDASKTYYSSAQSGFDATSGIDNTLTGAASAYVYHSVSSSYIFDSIQNTKSTLLDPFAGYRVLIRGDRSFNLESVNVPTYGTGATYASNLRMINATTLRATGNLIYGTVTYSSTGVSNTVTGTDNTVTLNNTVGGYSLIANPYVSPVQWGTGTGTNSSTTTVFGASTNVNGSIWYLDPTSSATGKYIAYNAQTGSSVSGYTSTSSVVGTGYIQPGQAVFVQTSAASPTVVFKETAKSTASNLTAVFGASAPMSKLYVSLLRQSGTAYNHEDAVAIAFDNGFGNDAYGTQDALKVANANDNISISDKGKSLSIDGRKPATASDVLPLSLSKLSGTSYQLQIDATNYTSNGFTPILKDSYKGTTTSLTSGLNTIDFTVDANNASTFSNRFSLGFKPTTLAVNSIVASATLNNNIATISWNTLGEKGVSRFEVEKSTDAKSFTKIGQATAKNASTASYTTTDNSVTATSYYRVKAISKVGTVSYSNVAKIQLSVNSKQFTVYPNPLVGKTLNVSFGNVAAGKYTVTINNVLGQKVQEVAISHTGGNGSHAITVNNTLAAGTYSVTIRETASGQLVHQSNLSVN